MNLEYFLVVAGLVIGSAALFVVRSMPSWIWLLVLFSLAMVPGDEFAGWYFRPPRDARDACERECDRGYGHRDELADVLALCRRTCP